MADYYSVLKKTVAALPDNTGAARRAIYQRARTAIVNQLKAYEPPLSPSEITNEQLRLEEAIRKVEAEAARETLGLGRAATTARPAQTPEPAPAPAPTPPIASSASPVVEERSQDVVRPSTNGSSETEAPPATLTSPATPTSPAERDPAEAPQSEPTVGGYRKDAGRNGPMAAEAARSGDPSRRREPVLGASEEAVSTDTRPPLPGDVVAGLTRGARSERASALGDTPMKPSRLPLILGSVLAAIILIGIAAVAYSQRDTLVALLAGEEPERIEPGEPPAAPEPEATQAPTETPQNGGAVKNAERLLDDDASPAAPDARSVTTTRIAPGPDGAEDVAPRQVEPEQPPATMTPDPELAQEQGPDSTADQQPPAAPAAPQGEAPGGPTDDDPTPAAPEEEPEVTPAPSAGATEPAQSSTNGEVAAVAQRSILYEEGADNDSGTASPGRAVWEVGTDESGGQPATVLKLRAEIPERGVSADIELKPNLDQSLPASHLLEIRFQVPPDFPSRGVADIPGLVMKTTEEARGDALIGASVKVADGYFWVALSNVPTERDRNLSLLRERGWIDIPMLYEDGKRAILTIEKGNPGTRAVNQAIDAWTQG